jgi:hypothetical protein
VRGRVMMMVVVVVVVVMMIMMTLMIVRGKICNLRDLPSDSADQLSGERATINS